MARGGAREGAGGVPKAPDDRPKPVTLKLTPSTIEAIKTKSDKLGISQAQLVTRAVLAFMAEK